MHIWRTQCTFGVHICTLEAIELFRYSNETFIFFSLLLVVHLSAVKHSPYVLPLVESIYNGFKWSVWEIIWTIPKGFWKFPFLWTLNIWTFTLGWCIVVVTVCLCVFFFGRGAFSWTVFLLRYFNQVTLWTSSRVLQKWFSKFSTLAFLEPF